MELTHFDKLSNQHSAVRDMNKYSVIKGLKYWLQNAKLDCNSLI